MGEEADRLIQRLQDDARVGQKRSDRRRDAAWTSIQRSPLEGQLTMAHLAMDGPLPAPPRIMPKEMQEQIARLPESQRAVRILAWNQDIPLSTALNQYNQYMGLQRKAEARRIAREEYEARFKLIAEAKSLEDLKPLLNEIVQHIWG